ncbi:hypothetical protein GT360_06060 [Vibrio astriarenae]|uniref:Uncharacterized protein n=1 Tax=Vibrio astriarenae TaxID=1481923 RepID=A0A7Z2T2K0_9VIBR|nr:hypothetical protein [Vibrio astriarenae]QIA63101.1 hypothetical protein GT360_06060 [Vibrio astriarenae]
MKKLTITLALGLSLGSVSTFAAEDVRTIGHECLQHSFTHEASECMEKAHEKFNNQKIEQIGDNLDKIEADLTEIQDGYTN